VEHSASDATSERPPLRERRLQVLTATECLALLEQPGVARVAFTRGARIELVTVNAVAQHGQLLIRTSASSRLADAVDRGSPLVLELDRLERGMRVGWTVIVRGIGTLEADDPRLVALPWPTESAEEQVVIRVTPTLLTGRRLLPGQA
jgi:hypothetical protein